MITHKNLDLLNTIGNNIRLARKSQGLTQKQLAFESGLELSQINRIELGKINTSVIQIIKICKVLEVNPGDILNFNIADIQL